MGSTESRTKDWAQQQSWELSLLLASHLLDQVHLNSGGKKNENPSASWLKTTILLTLLCAGWASAGLLQLVLGDQGQDALPDQGSGARGGRQTDVHLHACLHFPVHHNASLQGEGSLLQLIHGLQGFQSLTQWKETCGRQEQIMWNVQWHSCASFTDLLG